MEQSNSILGTSPLQLALNLDTEAKIEIIPLDVLTMIFNDMDLFTLQNVYALNRKYRKLALEIFPVRLQYKFTLILNRFKCDAAKKNNIYRLSLDRFVLGIFLGSTISELRHEVEIKNRELRIIRLRPDACFYDVKLYHIKLGSRGDISRDEDFYSPEVDYCPEKNEMIAFSKNNPNLLKRVYRKVDHRW